MTTLFRVAISLALALVLSCSRGLDDVCPNGEDSYVCEIPYELLYSDREYFVGRNVRVDGVLIRGVLSEPPGSEAEAVLLFSSAERAAFCDVGRAIKIVGYDPNDPSNVREGGQRYVSVVGRFSVGNDGYWGEIVLYRTPTPRFVPVDLDVNCLRLPPPV